MAVRQHWKSKIFGWKDYICPSCKRDKGMIYLDNENRLRYVCFCGINITFEWIKERYDFDKKEYKTMEKSLR